MGVGVKEGVKAPSPFQHEWGVYIVHYWGHVVGFPTLVLFLV